MPASHSTPWLPAIQIHQPVCGVYKRERLRTDFCATPFSFLCPWRRSPWARLTAGTDTALALRRPVAGTRAFGSKIGSNLAELPKAREASNRMRKKSIDRRFAATHRLGHVRKPLI